jgi:hypothetical protein
MNPGYGHGAEKSDPFSPHIASAECKKGKALPPQRPLLGLVTASVLLGHDVPSNETASSEQRETELPADEALLASQRATALPTEGSTSPAQYENHLPSDHAEGNPVTLSGQVVCPQVVQPILRTVFVKERVATRVVIHYG